MALSGNILVESVDTEELVEPVEGIGNGVVSKTAQGTRREDGEVKEVWKVFVEREILKLREKKGNTGREGCSLKYIRRGGWLKDPECRRCDKSVWGNRVWRPQSSCHLGG